MSRYYIENPEPVPLDWTKAPCAATVTTLPQLSEVSQAASALGKLGRGHKKTLTAEQRETKRVLMGKINAKRSCKSI